MNWKQMTIGKRIGVGFTLLILIALVLGGVGVINMNTAEKGSRKLAREYVPEVKVAAEIRGAANRLMYQMQGYGFTEDEKYYQNARVEMEAFDEAMGKADELAQKAVYLKKLKGEMKTIHEADQKWEQRRTRTMPVRPTTS